MTVTPVNGGDPIVISKDESKLVENYILNLTPNQQKYIVLYTPNIIQTSDGHVIPSSWVGQMLPFIKLDSMFNQYLGEFGLEVNLSKIPDFNSWHHTLIISISDQLRNMFTDGYIVDPRKDIIINWSLIPVKESTVDSRLYHPSWKDNRITNNYNGMVGFLLSRMQGDTSFEYNLSTNTNQEMDDVDNGILVERHFIAQILGEYQCDLIFYNSYIHFGTYNLDQTQAIIAIIEDELSQSSGKVITFSVTRISWLTMYKIVSKSLGYNNCVGYRINDSQKPYTFSCIIGSDVDLKSEYSKFNIAINQLLNEANRQYTDKTMSIHEAIERGAVVLT